LIQCTIQLLQRAVKKASTPLEDIRVGDSIIVTGSDSDVEGTVKTLIFGDNENEIKVELNTVAGVKVLNISNNNFIHIIKKANMLNLRKHHEYERDLKDMTKEDHQNKGRPEYGPVEKSDKSNLPTSKVSLSLRTQKSSTVYYYVDDKGFESRTDAEAHCDKLHKDYSEIKEEKD